MPMAGLLHVVFLWWALPRIIITLHSLANSMATEIWCTLGDKTVYCPWYEHAGPFLGEAGGEFIV